MFPLIKWKKLKIAISEPDSGTMCLNFMNPHEDKLFLTNYAGRSWSNLAHSCKLTPPSSVWFLSGDGNRVNVGISPKPPSRPTEWN